MNEVQSRKVDNKQKPFPGCLGRMVNLFDITAGVSGNKLLTDKAHLDASALFRSQSDVTRMKCPSYIDQIEDRKVVSDIARGSSDKQLNRSTPIKMLIDQEMTSEVCAKQNPPTLVAKLMGLDTFPGNQSATSVLRSYSSDFSGQYRHSRTPQQCWQQSDGFVGRGTLLDKIYQFADNENCKSIYETWQQSPKTGNATNKSPLRGRYNRDVNKKKIDLVRQKFVEAKCLSTDEKLRQSKEFEDALEVLSSNKDLLLEIFQESNPMLYQSLFDLQSNGHDAKRITVLRPTKMADRDIFSGSGKASFGHIQEVEHACSAVVWDKIKLQYSSTNQKVDEYPVQPTRIVVLKPSPGKASDFKDVTSPTPSSTRILPTKDFLEEPGEYEKLQSRRAKEMTKKMPENLAGSQHDGNFNYVYCNGYNGDESSFNKSEDQYPIGNCIDLEVTSLSPRHSWDNVNRCGSPYSSSSFSRASCSPESSVCREAKKRLSERWAMVTSNEHSQEQKLSRRSSSTLGEMLALTDVKKPVIFEDRGTGKGQAPRVSISCSSSNLNEGVSPQKLLRSKSLPVSSSTNRLDSQVFGSEVAIAQAPKEAVKGKGMKSSLKGKVSGLFFYRNKKSKKEKASVTQPNDECQLGGETAASPANSLGVPCNEACRGLDESGSNESSATPNLLSSRNSPDSTHQQEIIPYEPGLSVSKPTLPVLIENQDQPSPISVLDPPFEEDESTTQDYMAPINHDRLGPSIRHKSNSIDKSPPIESISRTLSWDDSHAEVATPYIVRPSIASPDVREEEEDWLSSVHALLLTVGIDDQMQSDSFSYRWHSPESALDPSLRDSYASLNDKEVLREAKRRQKRSKLKLVFDCVNNALEEITGYGSEKHPTGRAYSWGQSILSEGTKPMLVNLIVGHMKDLLSSELNCGDSHCLVVDRVVRKEVVGSVWVDLMKLEMDNFGKEIEGKLLEELVEEAVIDLTDRV